MAADERLRGSALGLCSAVLFGLSAPISKLLLPETPPLLLAGLLYVSAAGALLLVPRARREAPLTRADVPALAISVIAGAALGPPLMLWGLTRVSGLAGSLLLNLEAPFTMVLAVVFFGEHLSGREVVAAALVAAGAALLGGRGELSGSTLGASAIGLACLCWAIDNNFNARLSLKDPVEVLRVKALCAGAINLTIAFGVGQRLPRLPAVGAAVALGVFSYGVSFFLYLRAQRVLGAARQATLFAVAPFAGALASVPLLGDRPQARDLVAALLMAAGVVLLLRARHAHVHAHEAIEHDHAHVHDEHHRHAHEGPVEEPHSHPHRHDPIAHEHPHVSDAHHRHRH